MGIRTVSTDKAPLPVGPYSQAIACGDLLFISGQLSLDPKNGTIVGSTIGEQATKVLENLVAILFAEGLSIQNLVKTTVFLTDLHHLPAFNKLYESALGECRPARSVVAVKELPQHALVEIEAVACR